MPRLGGGQTSQSYLIANRKNSLGTLPTTTEYAPAPSSGNGTGHLSSLMGGAQRPPPPPPQRPLVTSTGSLGNGNAGFLSPMLSPLRVRSATTSELPTLAVNNKYVMGLNDQSPQTSSRTIWKAAEGGKGSLLPAFTVAASTPTTQKSVSTSIRREAPGRSKSSGPTGTMSIRSRSSHALPQTHQDINNSGGKSSLSLRRRTATGSASDDELDMNQSFSSGRREYRTDTDSLYRRRSNGSYSTAGSTGRPLWWLPQWDKLSRMKLGHILQVVIVLAVTALVWESHHKALFAAQQLTQFKEEESLLLLHLQKIEQQSIQLHENLSRLARVGLAGKADEKDGGGNGEGGREVDFDLIHKQTQQLYQMEEELNHEVKTLQTRIQQSARNHIIQEFGEGPVQVILELDFGPDSDTGVIPSGAADASPNRISILLWHDTPHAAWTWLEQIRRNVWDGAEFHWKQGHIIDAIPHEVDPLGGKIEFVEQSQHRHEAWTVGVREYDSGSIGMYINLQDNSNLHKHETCVGKVIDGFDALQRLLEVARTQRNEKDISIVVRKATATHVTKK